MQSYVKNAIMLGMALVVAFSAVAQAEIVNLSIPVEHTGYIQAHYVANGPLGDWLYDLNNDSLPLWGADTDEPNHFGDVSVKEWRAFLQFNMFSVLQPGDVVLSASFYYGGTDFFQGPGLPEFFRCELYQGDYNPQNLSTWDWHTGGYAGIHMFPANPVPAPIALNTRTVERLNSNPWGFCIRINDTSNTSAYGFYGAIAKRCKLLLTVNRSGIKSAAEEDVSFGHVKALFK